MVQLSVQPQTIHPILDRLQEMPSVPMNDEIINCISNIQPYQETPRMRLVINKLDSGNGTLNELVDAPLRGEKASSIVLDDTQRVAVSESLKHRVGLIQGPPGTGKSYCGAVLGRILFSQTDEKIMVMCETNHALDQFLLDLVEAGKAIYTCIHSLEGLTFE